MAKKYIKFIAFVLVLAFCIPAVPVKAAGIDQLATERFVYCYLTEKLELNTAAACGILANIESESSFHSDVLGDGGTSIGLCQWHNGRFSALMAYCVSKGLDYRTVQGQLEYLQYELRTSYPSLLKQLKNIENTAQGAYQAGHLWCIRFERPDKMEQKAVTRGNLAQFKYWNRYCNFAVVPEPEKVLEYLETHEPAPVDVSIPEAENENRFQADVPDYEEKSEPEVNKAAPKVKYLPYSTHHHPAEDPSENICIGISVGLCFVVLGDGITRKKFRLKEIRELSEENT